jgi:uncharacterized protein with HEPN domain
VTSHSAATLVEDALRAATRIAQFIDGKTQADYDADELLQSAVERQFTIMGEALVRLHREAPDVATRVPDLRAIIGFRNRLVHVYDRIDDSVVWTAATVDMPRAVAAFQAALKELGAG